MSYFRVGLVNLIKSNKKNYYKKKEKTKILFMFIYSIPQAKYNLFGSTLEKVTPWMFTPARTF